MKRAIVLSGGGSKGSYEIGVWKALKKLHISYDIVTGTSVGALNGALMVQKDYREAIHLWKNLTIEQITETSFNNSKGAKFITTLGKNIMQGGLDVTKLDELIKEVINTKRFYNSPIDFGLITVNLSTMKSETFTKDEIPENKLCDYLMASASIFPAFQSKTINGDEYVDGGYSDNLPINLALDMGATEIIAVDLKAIGLKKNIKNNNANIIYIKPNNNLASILIFDKEETRKGICYGYNDTMKLYEKLDGKIFTFKKGDLKKNFHRYKEKFRENLESLFPKEKKFADQILNLRIYKKIINKNENISIKQFNEIIENTGKVLKLDQTEIYRIKKYNKILQNSLEDINPISVKEIQERLKNKDYKNLMSTDWIIKYIYQRLIDLDDEKVKNELLTIVIALPKEFFSALYLYTIKRTYLF